MKDEEEKTWKRQKESFRKPGKQDWKQQMMRRKEDLKRRKEDV